MSPPTKKERQHFTSYCNPSQIKTKNYMAGANAAKILKKSFAQLSADDWNTKGDDATATHDFNGAIDCYSKAIDLDPTNYLHFSNRSAAYLSNHDATQALADAEKCIHLNPSWAKGYGQKGAALYEIGDFGDSVSTYKHGLGLDPDSADMRKSLADVQDSAQKYSCPSPELLYQAARAGDLPGINALLRMECGVNEFFKNGNEEYTALGWAIKFQQEEAVRLLLTAGADVHLEQHTEEGGRLPITVAANEGHVGVVELLMKSGASVHEHVDEKQITPLHAAAGHGHVEVARVLLAAGARVNALAKDRVTPLHAAAVKGHVEVARTLLAAGARVDAIALLERSHLSPMGLAVESGHAGVVELLIKAGASVHDHFNEEDGMTLLHSAASKGHVEVVRLLLAAGARVDAPTKKEGLTPLMACLNNSKSATTAEGLAAARKIVKLLIKAGADVNARDTRAARLTVLHYAVQQSCPGIVQDIMDTGVVDFGPVIAMGRAKMGRATEGSSGGAGAGAAAAAGAPGSSLVLKGNQSGKVQKKKKKKKKRVVKDENRVCDGPDCSSIGVNRCKACKRPAYCGVECQRAHWNAGHKQECKMWREEE